MNSKTKSVKINMIMNALLTMSALIFPLITFPYASRILKPEGMGKVGFATSVISYFAMFVQLGIPMYGVKACAKVRDDKKELSKVVHELLGISLFMLIVVYSVFFVSINNVAKFEKERPLFIVMGTTILFGAIGCEWLYKALEEYTYITIRSLIFKFIAVVSLLFLVQNKEDYIIYGGITIFAASASNILNFINLRKYIIFKWLGGYNFKRHIKAVLVFFSMSIAITIYTNLDIVMVGFIKDDVEVGYYSAAVKIKNILLSIVTSASTVLLPRASYYVDNNMMDEFYRILKKVMHFIILMSSSFTVYFMIYAREGIMLLSGEEYGGAILPMQFIMPTLFLIGITNVTGIQMMVPLGMETKVLYSVILGAIIDLIFNAFLIPIYGAVGAAIGTLLAEFGVLICQLWMIRNIRCKVFDDVPIVKVCVSIVGASLACVWIKILGMNAFWSLAISGIFFFGMYMLLLILTRNVLAKEILNQIYQKIKKRK